jgi:hypothetical protein
LHPEKDATPPDATSGFDVQLSIAPDPGCELMARPTEAVEFTVLPPLSSTVTTGWVPQVAPFAPPLGVVITSWLAPPTVMLKELLGADAVLRPSVASVAVRV